MSAITAPDASSANYFDATDGKDAQEQSGFDDGSNLYPCCAICCLNFAQFSYSCYPRYPDCVGCIAETSVCCIDTTLMGCKSTQGRADHYCVLIKTEQSCLSWSKIHSIFKGRVQCFCIDLRASCPKFGDDSDVPCMLALAGLTCCFSHANTCTCCKTIAQMKANSPGFFAARLQGAGIMNHHGYFATARPDGRLQWTSSSVGATEKWTATVKKDDPSKVVISSDATGRFLTNESNGDWTCNGEAPGPNQAITVSTDTRAVVTLQGRQGYLSVSAGPQTVCSSSTFARDYEKFTLWK